MKQDYLKYSFWSLLIQTCQESDSSLVNYFRFCPDDSLTLYGNSFVLVVEIKQVKFCHNYKPPSTRLWAWNPIKFGRRARSDSLSDRGPFFAILGSNYFMQLAIPGISFSWNDILIFQLVRWSFDHWGSLHPDLYTNYDLKRNHVYFFERPPDVFATF